MLYKLIKWSIRLIDIVVIFCLANLPSIMRLVNINVGWVAMSLLLFVWFNVDPSIVNRKLSTKRLRSCGNGCELLILFCTTMPIVLIYSLAGFLGKFPVATFTDNPRLWLLNSLMTFLVELIVFWNGIIRVYLTSEQLGIRWRLVGILCGWIPIAHLIVLFEIIKTVAEEVRFENEKILLNKERKEEQICATKYPILMVHGVFFRDYRYHNYWGRIPKQLEENGAVIYYGEQQSAASVEECGHELARRIQNIVKETGCEKVNIIAHSKGGLDCRYALTLPGIASCVASLTTINTPHRGCEFADYLLQKIPDKQKQLLANTYNNTLKKFGDSNPNFIEAVTDLTAFACKKRNENLLDVPGVYYQSVGSKLNRASNGRFPLNFCYQLVNVFDGPNDGLVGEKSFEWGEKYHFLSTNEKIGISHGDIIDLNHENYKGFDVREFFVQLVADLKKRGY